MSDSSRFVDFKAIKSAVSMEQMLAARPLHTRSGQHERPVPHPSGRQSQPVPRLPEQELLELPLRLPLRRLASRAFVRFVALPQEGFSADHLPKGVAAELGLISAAKP